MAEKKKKKKKSGFMRLPTELRIRIYEFVLLPASPRNMECPSRYDYERQIEQDADIDVGGFGSFVRPQSQQVASSASGCATGLSMDCDSEHIIGSTCNPDAPVMLTLKSQRRGKLSRRSRCNGSAAILATNKQIFSEAATVLYENTQVAANEPREWSTHGPRVFPVENAFANLPSGAAAYVRRFHLSVQLTSSTPHSPGRLEKYCILMPQHLPTVKIFSIHVDLDIVKGGVLDASKFESLHVLAERVRFMMDVHITSVWNEDGSGWEEPLDTEYFKKEKDIERANAKARVMRDQFVQSLSGIFAAYGKELKMVEE